MNQSATLMAAHVDVLGFEKFFQHEFPHERSDLSHWRKRLGDKLELLLAESLRVAHASGALRSKDLARVTVDTTVQPKIGIGSSRTSSREGLMSAVLPAADIRRGNGYVSFVPGADLRVTERGPNAIPQVEISVAGLSLPERGP